ncbi:tetratricopeptide repeat protein 13-like isoform X2 [Watersipora subatra]|uniref:tetratricopeptide repeat protein 13-like isoform X2 n=1 Tax=Watersipora subatra TaxID=2589382 RepID=UPI00355B8CA5
MKHLADTFTTFFCCAVILFVSIIELSVVEAYTSQGYKTPGLNDFDGSSSMLLDNQLMRDMYRVSTDKVYSLSDIQRMIDTISYSNHTLKLSEAVSGIVNLKLIKKLRFDVLDVFYKPCSDMDLPLKDEIVNHNEGYSIDIHVASLRNEPSCLTRFSDSAYSQNDCTQESCRFYLHCVLHRKHCSENLLELASNYLLREENVGAKFSFATGDETVDRSIAKAIAMSQFNSPEDAVKYATAAMEEQGEHIGLLHARILATARSGFSEGAITSLVNDAHRALELDPTNEWSIYRKSAVLLAVAKFFDALETLDLGITLYPNNSEFYEMKGSCHLQLRELDLAEHCYRQALELDLEDKKGALQKLGLIFYSQGKLPSAITVYKELLELNTKDTNVLVSIAQCYKQEGESKKALRYANKAVNFTNAGQDVFLFRGILLHEMGHDIQALEDLKHTPTYTSCCYQAGLVQASLGQFYEAVKSMVSVTCGVTPLDFNHQANTEYIKATYLINYYRYLHSKLDNSLWDIDLDRDLRPAFKDGWAKGSSLDMSECFASEQMALSPDITPVVAKPYASYDFATQRLLCLAERYGRLMQVKADSFVANVRFNLAMGLAVVHVGQQLRELWSTAKKRGKMSWRQLYEMSLPFRRLADMETPVIWLSQIYKEEHIIYHNEVSFYRSRVKNLRMKSYFDLVFGLTRSMISRQYPQHTTRRIEVEVADTPEFLVAIAKAHIPTRISTTVPSTTKPERHFDGGKIVLAATGYSGASLYLNIPTTHKKTKEYDYELSLLFNKFIMQASKLRTGTLDTDAAINGAMTMAYYFFNLCPLSRGSASVGLSTLVGMFLSVDKEITASLPIGKMLDMEATLSGAPDEFRRGTKNWFRLASVEAPVTSLPLVAETFPTVRSLLEVLSSAHELDCER